MAGSSNFERQIHQFLLETENDVEVLGGISTDDENVVENSDFSDHKSDTEQSADSDIGEVSDNWMVTAEPNTEILDIHTQGTSEITRDNINSNFDCHLEMNIDEYTSDEDELPYAQRVIYYSGKHKRNKRGLILEQGCKWYRKPPPMNVRTLARNLITHLPGVKGHAKNATTQLQAWEVLFSNQIIHHVVDCTNKYIDKKKNTLCRERDATNTSFEEIRALIGILYILGVMKSSHKNTQDIWSKDGTGIDLVISTMSRNRFHFLLRCLRFDDPATRTDRKKVDKITHIREIFQSFVSNCKSAYTIGEYATVDEKLEAFRGRCSFRQYIKNKPSKYGIKIFMLCDSRTFYTSNMEIYAGAQPEGPFRQSNAAKDVTERMIQPISGTNRNVTIDNWFTSIPLAVHLLKRHKLTIVGTLRKDKREVPPEFLTTKNKSVYSSMFGFHEDKMTLVSYVPNKKKVVLMLSSMHYDNSIDISTGEQKKPDIVIFYNSTKGGVDVVDRMCSNYSVGRVSNRWPLTLFYCMLDIAGINSQIIYQSNNDDQQIRRNYLKLLGKFEIYFTTLFL